MTKKFSASTVKSWFQYSCERKVRYELSTDDELATVPVVKDIREKSWAVLGTEYEKRVVHRLHHEQGVLQPTTGDDALSETLTAAFLRGLTTQTYAAQVNLRPMAVPSFLEGTGLHLNRNLADLVRRQALAADGNTGVLTLIDIKATRRATAFHKTQVAFYARVLEALLKEMRQTSPVNAEIDPCGEIWYLPDDSTAEGDSWHIERFSLTPYLRLVDDFCINILPKIARTQVGRGVDDTFFHIYFKCEQCDFLGHCFRAISPELAPALRDVSAVPGLSHEAKRALGRLEVKSVLDLSRAAGLGQAPGIGWSLSRRASQLRMRAQALSSGNILRTEEQQTFLMPPRADTALLLSVDHDPVEDRIATIGYQRVDRGRVTSEHICVPKTSSLGHESEALLSVLGALIADLTAIDHENEKRASGGVDGIFAHIYFYEPAEAVNLQRAVGRHLDNQHIRSGLLNLVRLFPPEDVVPEPEFRGVHHLPATAVRSVIEQLWALPISVAHDLRQVSQVLADNGARSAYHPEQRFARPFHAYPVYTYTH